MADDQIVDLLDLMTEDLAWLSEFYSAVANSDIVTPMLLCPGRPEPEPIYLQKHGYDSIVLDPETNEYKIIKPTTFFDRTWYLMLYSSPDVYKSVKPILEAKYLKEGRIVDPVTETGRRIINACCKKKHCAMINLYVSGSRHYILSPDQMEIIRQRPIIARPQKNEPEKAIPAVITNTDERQKLDYYIKKIEKLEKGNRQLQSYFCEALRDNAGHEAKYLEYEKRIAELETSLAAFTDAGVPVTVSEAVENAARRFASRLVIHPRVMDIVEAWPYKKKSRCVAHTVKMLEAVARTLYGMKFESPDGFIDPLQFQAITGYELAMTEGRATKRNADLDELRHCRYEGRDVSIYAHLKKRIDRNLHMRIYIGFLEEERKILIGQVGPHMANSQTAGL